MLRRSCFALVLLLCGTTTSATKAFAYASGPILLAQTQTDPSQSTPPTTSAPDTTASSADAQAPEEPIGNVATVVGMPA